MTVEYSPIETKLEIKPAFALQARTKTDRIVVHHTATDANITMEEVNQSHINRGFSMIGYHKFIEKSGVVKQGRPDWAVGAHAIGANYDSISICLAGNFEIGTPTEAQMQSLVKTIISIWVEHPGIIVQKHSEIQATACPGKNFPWVRLKKELEAKPVEQWKKDLMSEAMASGLLTEWHEPDSTVPMWKVCAMILNYKAQVDRQIKHLKEDK